MRHLIAISIGLVLCLVGGAFMECGWRHIGPTAIIVGAFIVILGPFAIMLFTEDL